MEQISWWEDVKYSAFPEIYYYFLNLKLFTVFTRFYPELAESNLQPLNIFKMQINTTFFPWEFPTKNLYEFLL
jgi:hypothetical protein